MAMIAKIYEGTITDLYMPKKEVMLYALVMTSGPERSRSFVFGSCHPDSYRSQIIVATTLMCCDCTCRSGSDTGHGRVDTFSEIVQIVRDFAGYPNHLINDV